MPGLYFDQLKVGQVFEHDVRRTITEMDNVLISSLTHNPSPLHLDEEYCRDESDYGRRILNESFTLGLVVGVSIEDTTLGTTVGNLGWKEVRFPKPIFHGDTLHCRTTVEELRESKSRPEAGITIFFHEAFNQKNELVASCKRVALMKRKPT